jgi:hypothetical protein
MALVLAILVFATIAMAVFAFLAAVYSPTSVLGARLRSLLFCGFVFSFRIGHSC